MKYISLRSIYRDAKQGANTFRCQSMMAVLMKCLKALAHNVLCFFLFLLLENYSGFILTSQFKGHGFRHLSPRSPRTHVHSVRMSLGSPVGRYTQPGPLKIVHYLDTILSIMILIMIRSMMIIITIVKSKMEDRSLVGVGETGLRWGHHCGNINTILILILIQRHDHGYKERTVCVCDIMQGVFFPRNPTSTKYGKPWLGESTCT